MKNQDESEKSFLTQKEVAAILRRSTAWCERVRWCGGGPPFVKIGGRILYPTQSFWQWVEEHPLKSSTTSLHSKEKEQS